MSSRLAPKRKSTATRTKACPSHVRRHQIRRAAARSPGGAFQFLQRTIGNQATRALVQRMARESVDVPAATQTKLMVGPPGDMYEREADAAASRIAAGQSVDKMSRTPAGTPMLSALRQAEYGIARRSSLWRQEAEEDDTQEMTSLLRQEKEEEPVQARSATAGINTSAAERAMARGGAGNELTPALQRQMEDGFGTDFSGVRVHTGAAAGEAAKALNARAFTRGSDVYLARGESQTDRRLMGHELTHVVQQHSAPALQGNVIQASFISFVVKMGAKQVSKGVLKNFIKTQIKSRIKKLAIKKFAKRFAQEADRLLDILEDPWWVTAIGFIPIAGDAFDLVRVPRQIKKAMDRADALERKIKKILRIQGQWAEKLIPASLKRSPSYFDDLAKKSYAELVQMASIDPGAAKMKKLIDQQHRLMGKL